MGNFLDGVTRAVGKAVCDTLATDAALFPLLFPATGGQLAGSAMNFLYNSFCDRPRSPVPPSALVPPFTGGQCVGASYTVTVRVDRVDPETGGSQSGYPSTEVIPGVPGPVNRIGSEFANQVAEVKIYANTPEQGYLVEAVGPITQGGNPYRDLAILSVQREGGLPDNCGNPAPAPPVLPPGSNKSNQNITYVNSEGNTVVIPVVIALGYASVNLTGNFEIPVALNFNLNPELNVTGTVNLQSGDISFNFANTGTRGDCETARDDRFAPDGPLPPAPPDASVPVPPSPPSQEPAELRKVLRGVVVTTSQIGPNVTRIFAEDGPDIIVPALGYVQFLVRVGNSGVWTPDYAVKNERCLIECTWPSGAIDVKAVPRPGVVWKVNPIYLRETVERTFPVGT